MKVPKREIPDSAMNRKDCEHMSMAENQLELLPEQMESVVGGLAVLGVYRLGFHYKEESLRFFQSCVGKDVYLKAINSDAGRTHPYAVARAILNQADWEKYVWIEEHGSLDGFPK